MTLFESSERSKERDVNKAEFERLCTVEDSALDLIDFLETSGIVKQYGNNLALYVRKLRKAIADGHK